MRIRHRIWGVVAAVGTIIIIKIYTVNKGFLPSNMKQPELHLDMIKAALDISKHSKTVMVGVINDAFIPLAYSWLCNTKEMGIHNKVLFITTDEQTSVNLKRDWPEVNVVSMNISELGGDREYGQVGYIKVNVKRHQYIYQLLSEGFELLHFEVDCLWLRNPLPYLQSHVGYDMLLNPVTNRRVYASGFVYIFNTEKTIRVWELLVQDMNDLAHRIGMLKDDEKVNEGLNDQPFFSNIISKKVPGLNQKVLSLDKFQDGKWYDMEEHYRNASQPYIINNNWIIGNKNKIERAKKWDHWFIDENMKCKMDLVHKIVKQL